MIHIARHLALPNEEAGSIPFDASGRRRLYGVAPKLAGRIVVLSAGALLACSTGWAAAPSPAVKEQCGAEIRSKCLRPWRLTPDAISACVTNHQSELSPTCQGFWETAQICRDEMADVCGGLNPFTIKSCLRDSRARFSPLCQETLNNED